MIFNSVCYVLENNFQIYAFFSQKRPAQRFYHCFIIKRQNMKPYPVIARQHKPPRSPLSTIAGKHFAIPVRIRIFGAKHTVFS